MPKRTIVDRNLSAGLQTLLRGCTGRVIAFVAVALVCCCVRALPYLGARAPVETDRFTVVEKTDGERARFLSESFFIDQGVYTFQYDSVTDVETEVVLGDAHRLVSEDGISRQDGIRFIPLRITGGSAHREIRILAERNGIEAAVLTREYYERNGIPQARFHVSVVYRPMLTAACYAIDTLLFFLVTAFFFLFAIRPLRPFFQTKAHRRAGQQKPYDGGRAGAAGDLSVSAGAWIPLMLFVLVVLISLPLFGKDLAYGHDTLFHVRRIASLAEELFSGRIPPRIAQTWKNGHGYPVSIFYGELFLIPAAVLFRLGMPLLRAYQFYAMMMNAVAVWLSYRCFLALSKEPQAAFSGSVIYAGGVRFAANLYLRGAIGENTAMAVMPLAVLGFYHLFAEGKTEDAATGDRIRADGSVIRFRAAVCLVTGFTALLHAHTLSTIQVCLFAALFCLMHLRPLLAEKRLRTLLFSALFTLLLNLWFVIPFVDYYLRHSFFAKRSEPVADTAVTLRQLLFPADAFKTAGAGTIALLLCGAAGLVYTFVLHVRRRDSGQRQQAAVSGNLSVPDASGLPPARYAASCLALTALAVWMGTTLFPWAGMETQMPALYGLIGGRMQYVWRYFSPASLLACVSAMLVFRILHRERKTLPADGVPDAAKKHSRVWQPLTLLAVIAAVSFAESMPVRYGVMYPAGGTPRLCAADVWNGDGGDALYMFSDLVWTDVPEAVVTAGEGISFDHVTHEGTTYEADVTNATDAEGFIEFPVWNYYGYEAWADAAGGAFSTLPVTDGEKHRVRTMLPAGFSGHLTVGFREPWYWRVAGAVSCLALAGFLTFCFKCCRARHTGGYDSR